MSEAELGTGNLIEILINDVATIRPADHQSLLCASAPLRLKQFMVGHFHSATFDQDFSV
jgi:hypothetical protein